MYQSTTQGKQGLPWTPAEIARLHHMIKADVDPKNILIGFPGRTVDGVIRKLNRERAAMSLPAVRFIRQGDTRVPAPRQPIRRVTMTEQAKLLPDTPETATASQGAASTAPLVASSVVAVDEVSSKPEPVLTTATTVESAKTVGSALQVVEATAAQQPSKGHVSNHPHKRELIALLKDPSVIIQCRRLAGGGWANLALETSSAALALLQGNTTDYAFRIKPAMVMVNGFQVPASEEMPLITGSDYYVPSVSGESFYLAKKWCSSSFDFNSLKRGLVHLLAAHAATHAKAMLGISPEESK